MKFRSSSTSAASLSAVLMTIDAALTWAEFVMIASAIVSIFSIMLLVFCDAALRYTLNSPLSFSSDLIILYLISAAIFPALSYTLRHGGHVNVDLFAAMLPRRIYHTLIGVALIASAGVVGLMAYQIVGMTWADWIENEVQTGIFAWPLWPSKAVVAIGVLMLALRLLHIGVTSLVAAATGDYSYAIQITTINDDPLEDAV